MATYEIRSIGTICNEESGTFINIDKEYIPALKALEGFRHISVLWWFSEFDDDQFRSILQTPQPYRRAPETMGVFATRSPIRPNPIALTTVEVIHIDEQKGIIQIAYIDAHDNTPVLDLKPYTPSFDRIETPCVPDWCKDWPKSFEESSSFPWDEVFLFDEES